MMFASAPSCCPACGAAIPPNAPMGVCALCLWQFSIENGDTLVSDEPWMRLGDYELLEEIARGGMGVVYRARQLRLKRTVAVKVLQGGEFADGTTRRRFLIEAEIVARLRHPGIVAIHDVGEDAGVLWFSMDYLSGGNLVQKVGRNPLPARQAAECVRRVANAVKHAHEHGVLHRDLKPSNILLDDQGLPCVSDFGIARQSIPDHADFTRTGHLLGSPNYAAPEQALDGLADTRTDVYGLGALLYHLLTSRPPFQGPTLDSILLQLRQNDPVAPKRLNPTTPRHLETICMRCLQKDPARRYATVLAVEEDLTRFLNGEPISARPTPPIAHLWRWGRRHPGIAALSTLVVALLGLCLISALAFLERQQQLERRAVLVATAQAQRTATVDGSRTRALDALREAWRIQPSDEIRNDVIACLSLPEITHERIAPPQAATSPARGEPIQASIRGHDVLITDARSGRLLLTLEHPLNVLALDWRNGLIAASCEDRLLYVWDAATGRLVHRLSGHEGTPTSVIFAPNGQEVVTTALDGYLRIWHAARGTEILHVDDSPQHCQPVWWSDDGARLHLQRAEDPGVDVYRFDWPRSVKILAPPGDQPHTENIHTLALTPDGRLAAVVDEKQARIWDVERGQLLTSIAKGPSEWLSVSFAPDGSALWLCGFDLGLQRLPIRHQSDGTIVIAPPERFPTHPGMLLAGIRPDGSQLILSNNTESLWFLTGPEGTSMRFHQRNPLSAAFSPDSRLVATSSYSQPEVLITSTSSGRIQRTLQTGRPANRLTFTLDGRHLWIITGHDVTRLDTLDWQPAFRSGASGLRGLSFSADGQYAASLERGAIRLLRANNLDEIARLTIPPAVGSPGNATLAFDADGSTLVAHTSFGTLVVWDLSKLREELHALGMNL